MGRTSTPGFTIAVKLVRRGSVWLALWLAGCSQPATPPDGAPLPPGRHHALLWAEQSQTLGQSAARRPFDPFEEQFFYLGDTHFHSGYSGDNVGDKEPLVAYQAAYARSQDLASRNSPRLGGFFLFVTDHITYIKTRIDMDESRYQAMLRQADDISVDLAGPDYTFTAFAGAELTGLARSGSRYPAWDDKFGHLNLFLMDSIRDFVENDLSNNMTGSAAMERFASDPQHLGQFNHPGYGNEPRTGDDADHLYPYTPTRDEVFRFIEVNDDRPNHWEQGVSQYNVCLRHGYHVSPVVGTDIHNTAGALTGQARTIIVAPSTVGRPLADRRALLMGCARRGLVYATENPTLEITWSLNDYPMGSRLLRPSQATLSWKVYCHGGSLKQIELLGDRVGPLSDGNLDNESQCTQVVGTWKPDEQQHQGFSMQTAVASEALASCHYLYLKVTLESGQRAVTAPVYLESAAAE